MEGAEKQLKPWEVPPGDEYWEALLLEGECEEDRPLQAETKGSIAHDEHVVSEQLRSDLGQDQDSQEPRQDDQAEGSANWETFLQYQVEEKVIDLCVTGYNRGGLLVRWDGVTGFVPASQLCESIPYNDDQSRMDALAARVGCVLQLKVIEVDASRNRLIFSERAARHVSEPDLTVLDKLNPGDVCHGQITNLCAFGAFVNLGGIEGLIHISEISWGRVTHPADVLESGQEVEVYILNVDRELGRVGLSIKRLHPDPWNTVDTRYHVGQVIAGTITHIVNFGAFVRLEEGLEGLIHSSELSGIPEEQRPVLREGDEVQLSIVSIEGMRHRIGLSLVWQDLLEDEQDVSPAG